MNEISPELQIAFSVGAITSGFWLFGVFFMVCNKLHSRIRLNNENLKSQHDVQTEVTGTDVWTSITHKSLLDQRLNSVESVDLWIRLTGGFGILSGIAGFVVLWLRQSYGFAEDITPGTLIALSIELTPFAGLAAILATLFVTYRVLSLDRLFSRAADITIPLGNNSTSEPCA